MRGWGLLLLAVAASAQDGDPARWHQTLSPHFDIQHESAFSPAGLTLELEKLHNRLRLDLSMFAPWMAKERITLNVYASQQSYLRGRFKPPSWSNGVAFAQLRTVVTYWGQGAKGYSVLGHETTHLLFEGWWAEVGKTPPVWLNEGLAMLEETGEAGADKSDWQNALENIDPRDYIAFDRFVKIVPTRDLKDDKERVTVWYTQAYGTVRLLYKARQRMQFFNFCNQLRDGKSVEDALWKVYRLRGLKGLEKEFYASLKHRRGTGRPSEPSASAPPPKGGVPRTLKSVGFGSGGFKGLVPESERR
ncbi:hypothetical protein EPO15_16805 [bacterium]|nr:MAG: hypothetical protein EPO15_16805 [bacterium]